MTCEPIYTPLNPYSKATTPYSAFSPYSKLCSPGILEKIFEDGVLYMFEDGNDFIFN